MKAINVDKLMQIRSNLPFGSTKKIAEKTGLSRTYVSNVLNNKANNLQVIEAAYAIIEQEKARQEALNLMHISLIPEVNGRAN